MHMETEDERKKRESEEKVRIAMEQDICGCWPPNGYFRRKAIYLEQTEEPDSNSKPLACLVNYSQNH